MSGAGPLGRQHRPALRKDRGPSRTAGGAPLAESPLPRQSVQWYLRGGPRRPQGDCRAADRGRRASAEALNLGRRPGRGPTGHPAASQCWRSLAATGNGAICRCRNGASRGPAVACLTRVTPRPPGHRGPGWPRRSSAASASGRSPAGKKDLSLPDGPSRPPAGEHELLTPCRPETAVYTVLVAPSVACRGPPGDHCGHEGPHHAGPPDLAEPCGAGCLPGGRA